VYCAAQRGANPRVTYKTACCVANPNDCHSFPSSYSWDRSASSNFLFRLQPGELARFLPNGGTSVDATYYQRVAPNNWPIWGHGHDLDMGYSTVAHQLIEWLGRKTRRRYPRRDSAPL
jgi:hypothetical protein